MIATPVERRLRLFCRMLALIASVGVAIELWLVDHTGSAIQWLPFGMCALIAISVLTLCARRSRLVLRLHRCSMLLVLAGSAFGVYSHLTHNMSFAREIRPAATSREIWIAGVRGANPLLAAGALAMAAAMGLVGGHGEIERRKSA